MTEKVIAAIKRGEVVILPLEHSYVYACDAFSLAAVNRLHQLRNDPPGVAAQVIVGKARTLGGLAQGVSPEITELTEKFWPGLLTLNLPQNQSLSWDLGDGGNLTNFVVRMPDQISTLEVVNATGPLAIASATLAGTAPITRVENNRPLSTVVSLTGENLAITRVGAVTLEALRKVAPTIELANQ